ncbi:flagellar basal body L-ring protein FlgH [Hylemonella gracilis]|jgi:flagellar L-ring protein precursor FlgH|uniref:flagellar basal body L-ring protein FlgH n=1 Tax=Hylemonella gracilis TaxID=80880 RepID=UPI001A953E4C|nr:flagellar basal body L-ring protein FlgH [Hylemonella gracilis]
MKRLLAPIAAHARLILLPCSLGAALLAGCTVTAPQPAKVDFATPTMAAYPAQTVPAGPASGSLFQTATYRMGFEDRRARQVGDTVTIRIVENVSASQQSSATTNRSSSISGGISAVPGLSAGSLGKFDIGAENKSDFSGKGGTSAANNFSGSITAVVAEVLPNGHLVVVGEKQIGLNQNVDVMRFTGTVDPLAIQPGNIISSTSIANVRVESKGRGPQYDVQTVGWLTRFFHTLSPF